MSVYTEFRAPFPSLLNLFISPHIKPSGLRNPSACCIPKKTLPAFQQWKTGSPWPLFNWGVTGQVFFFNGSCSPKGLWWLVAPLTGFCILYPATHTLLATHSGTQQNVQEVQMSLLLDLFKFPFIFKGFLSLVDHLVWGRKG